MSPICKQLFKEKPELLDIANKSIVYTVNNNGRIIDKQYKNKDFIESYPQGSVCVAVVVVLIPRQWCCGL